MASWFLLVRRRSFLPRVPIWVVGVAAAMPVAATIQGCLMLQQYRKQHGHAPIPISPSQGLVVANIRRQNSAAAPSKTNQTNTTKPLRLLVIGDSLAAGVGTSQSGTPILPQAIARSLSTASDGRAVHWTCIGTPGASSSQIIHDIRADEESPSLLELKYSEWQLAKRNAQEWWETRKQTLVEEDKQEENKARENRIKKWWLRLRKDVNDLKEVVKVDKEEVMVQRMRTRRKTTLDPDVTVNQYDIAVVLTGLNDIKDAWMPFMMPGPASSTTTSDESGEKADSLKEALMGIMHALRRKMKLNLSDDNEQKDEDSSSQHGQKSIATSPKRTRGPLVVFPALPMSPLPLTHYPPLSWFLVPLIRMVDNNKRLLAQRYPGLVLYVDPPSPSDFRDIEAGRGALHASRRAEQVLLQITNVTQRAQEKVKELMEQHYNGKTKKTKEEAHKPLVYESSCRDHQLVEIKDAPGSTLLAQDRIHPNDQGYDFWGRHIAAAIVREWNKDETSS